MSARPKPPANFDENPHLDTDFFARAKPATFGESARLRKVLKTIIEAHDAGEPLDKSIAEARTALHAAE